MVVRYAGGDGEGKEHKLFVGMLAKSTTPEQVEELFRRFGTVKEVYVMKDSSGQSKGCAFVKMLTRDSGQMAINALNEIHQDEGAPRKMTVRFAETKQQKAQRTATKQLLAPLGIPPSAAAALPRGLLSAVAFGGFGQAAAAGQYGADRDFGWGRSGGGMRQPAYDYGQAQQLSAYGGYAAVPASPAKGPSGSNVFAYNIPEGFEDVDLMNMFSNFGQVLSATVFKDRHTGISRGFGFVSFDNPTSAAKSIGALDGFLIAGKRLKVQLKKGDGGPSGPSAGSRGFNPY